MKVGVVASIAGAAVIGVAVGWLARGGSAPVAAPVVESAEVPRAAASQELAIAALEATVATLRADVRGCRRAERGKKTPEASPPEAQAKDERGPDSERARERGGEADPAAGEDDAARTAAWADGLAKQLGLSEEQRGSLVELAQWAEKQRDDLAERADSEDLEAGTVRDEIALQREEYEKRMKRILDPSQLEQFETIQGIERRPPTFSRVPWIMGDRTVTR